MPTQKHLSDVLRKAFALLPNANLFGLPDAQAARGIATHSSDNHGTCLSYAVSRHEVAFTALVGETGAELAHPCNDPRVVAGQGICALKPVDQVKDPDAPDTIADGPRELTWCLLRSHVTDFLTVLKAEIIAAMKLIWKFLKIPIEPSSVVPIPAVLRHRDIFAGHRVGIIITGGNVSLKNCLGKGD